MGSDGVSGSRGCEWVDVVMVVGGDVGVSCWHHTGMVMRWRHPNA